MARISVHAFVDVFLKRRLLVQNNDRMHTGGRFYVEAMTSYGFCCWGTPQNNHPMSVAGAASHLVLSFFRLCFHDSREERVEMTKSHFHELIGLAYPPTKSFSRERTGVGGNRENERLAFINNTLIWSSKINRLFMVTGSWLVTMTWPWLGQAMA